MVKLTNDSRDFGYGTITTLLLTAPPFLFTALFCLFNTWYSDRTSKRSPHMIYPSIVGMVGMIITLATTNNAARYFALFLMMPGAYGCFQVSNAWMANIAARPQKKRAIALAMNNSIGNIALVWTPYLYPASDGPRYVTAWSVNLTLTAIVLTSSLALSYLLKRDNKKLDALEPQIAAEEGEKSSTSAHDEKHGGTREAPVPGDEVRARYRYQT
jgi:MFS family permease